MSDQEYAARPSSAEVQAELDRILASRVFWHAEGLSRFLRYIVEESLAGRGEAIKEYSVGLTVFDRGTSFDPKADTIVRVQARRLRSKLAEYYASNGHPGTVVIELPKGTYSPIFRSPPAGNPEQATSPLGSPSRFRFWRTRQTLVACVLVTVVLALALLHFRRDLFGGRPVFEAIAVLPFESLSSNSDQH